jgi:hypothetical protein
MIFESVPAERVSDEREPNQRSTPMLQKKAGSSEVREVPSFVPALRPPLPLPIDTLVRHNMNLRSNIFLLIICAMVSVGMIYHDLLNINTLDATSDEITFAPPQSEPHHVESNPNSSTFNQPGLSTPTTTTLLDIESLFNFTIPDPEASGRQAPQRRNGTKYKSPFKRLNNGNHWWAYTDSCFAVDDVCRYSQNRWFYTNYSNANEKTKWQPSFELKYMPQAHQKGAYADARVQMTVDASHRISWRKLEKSNQCVMSNDPYHVVLQSLYNVSSNVL